MELQEINKALPKRAVKLISEKLKVSHSLVSLVLSGKRENEAVLDAALDLIEETKQKRIEREDRLKNLLSK